MNSALNSFACLTVFSFSVYIILRIFSRSFSAVFKNDSEKHVENSFVKPDTHEIRRDMGIYETHLAELNTRFATKIYAVLSLKSAVSLRRENINNTLLLLARKHPILRARMTSDHKAHASRKQFIICPEKTFVPELRFVNTSNWKIVLEEELISSNKRLDDELFWKTVVVREQYEAREKLYINTLLFLFDPVVVDRISVVKFTEDFITMLCGLVNCDIRVDNTRTINLELPTEEFLKPPFLVLLFSVFKSGLMKILKFVKHPLSSQQKEKTCKFWAKPVVVMKCISADDTSLLLKYCHYLNCSLAALFITAWSEIMSSRTGSTKALCHRKPVRVIVDYRTLLSTEVPQSYLCNSSSYFHLQLLLKQWDQIRHFGAKARYCEHLLNSAVKRKKHLDLIWQLKYQSSNTELHVNHPVSSPLEIANVGTFCFKSTWPFSLHEIFIGCCSTSTVNLTLVVVNGKLYCGMHLNSHFSGCTDLLNALFARIVQNMASNHVM